MSRIRGMALCAVLLLLQACASPYPKPEPEPKDAEVIGLGEYIRNAAEANPSEPVRVDVVAIHGMCVHGASWEQQMIQTIGAVLGLPAPLSPKAASARDPNAVGKTVFSSPTIPGLRQAAGVQVTLHTIVWSPLVMPAREALCYDVSKATKDVCDGKEGRPLPGFQPKRAWANAALKNILMDGCLVDAIYYSGAGKAKLRQFISEKLQEAIQPSDGTSSAAAAPALFILSESLGSKMIFDVVKAMKDEKESRVANLAAQKDPNAQAARADLEQLQQNIGRTVTIFMAANQIPILSLADEEAAGAGIEAFKDLHNQGRQALRKQGQVPRAHDLRFVAISDPNDLLTWRLRNSKSAPDAQARDFVDVTFTNSREWLGIFSEPFSAHTTYFNHDPIRSLVRDGIHRSQ